MTDMPPKLDPETLVLRGQPRHVVRFKRNVLIGVAALGCFGILGLTWAGLQGPAPVKANPVDASQADKASETPRGAPDQVQALPKTYSDLPTGVPRLGPPLPGDLGKPILDAERATPPLPTTTEKTSVTSTAGDQGLFYQRNHSFAEPVLTGQGPSIGASLPAASGPGLTLTPEVDQNAQGRKVEFASAKTADSIYNSHSLETPASPYQVMAGTIISASLVTGLNSDLPGTVIAQVTDGVFDTVSGTILLIPIGTRLIGEYDSVVAFGQSRALVVWKRMVLPDGSSLQIDNMPATDTSGYTGLADRVDIHTWSLLKGVGLSTLLGIAGQDNGGNDSDLVRAFRMSTAQTANQAGQRIVEKTLNVQPTLRVRPGWQMRVIVQKDLILRPYLN